MIQSKRFLISAPLAVIDLAKSGEDWFSEFLFSNADSKYLKAAYNDVVVYDRYNNQHSFSGRLVYSGMIQSDQVDVLNESVNMLDSNAAIFRLNNLNKSEKVKLLNLGITIFEKNWVSPDDQTKQYFLMSVCQDADDLGDIRYEFVETLTGEPIAFFKGLNHKHVDVIGLLHALVPTTKVFSLEKDKYELIAKKLIAENKGVYGYGRPKFMGVREKSVGGEIVCMEATVIFVMLDSQINVKFELNDYTTVADAKYDKVSITTSVMKDGSAFTENLDMQAIVDRHLDVDSAFKILVKEYQEKNNPPL